VTAAKDPTITPPQKTCAARPDGPYGLSPKAKCTKPTRSANAALCQEHEAQWRVVAKARAVAVKVAAPKAAKPKSNVVRLPASVMSTQPLPASAAAFATPDLAAKAKAKRAPSKPAE
jgi:hypothetical protein